MENQFGKLQTLTVRGYKSIRSIDWLALHDLNIIIGQNGAAKSNFVSLFQFLARFARGELSDFVVTHGGLDKVLYFGPRVTEKLTIYFKSGGKEYEVDLLPTSEGTLVLGNESHTYHGKIPPPAAAVTTALVQSPEYPIQISPLVRNMLADWRVYHFHDTSTFGPLRRSSPLTEPEQLAGDGGNLPAFLYFLQEQHPSTFQMFVDVVRQVTVPGHLRSEAGSPEQRPDQAAMAACRARRTVRC
jgi:predicted ATPase